MRPTKYNDEVLAQAKDYLRNYEKHDHPFPSIIGLSTVLGIAKSTLSAWKHDSDKSEFSDTLERIKDKQHLQLINKGIKGEFNAAITKLMLHNFDYSDKKQVEQNTGVQVIGITQGWDDYSHMTDDEIRASIANAEND